MSMKYVAVKYWLRSENEGYTAVTPMYVSEVYIIGNFDLIFKWRESVFISPACMI